MIRRIPRLNHAEEQAAFVLVKVESSGSNQLDVKLIGTDQESVFSVTCKAATRSPSGAYPGF